MTTRKSGVYGDPPPSPGGERRPALPLLTQPIVAIDPAELEGHYTRLDMPTKAVFGRPTTVSPPIKASLAPTAAVAPVSYPGHHPGHTPPQIDLVQHHLPGASSTRGCRC